MTKINFKGGTLLAPLPAVMVSCGDMAKSNIITVAWTGIINSDPPKTYISVRPTRHSYEIIKSSGEFVLNLTTEKLVFATDICGVKSGKDYDKFKELRLNKQKSQVVSCPSIEESPLSIECKVTDIIKLGSHDMFVADIVATTVDGDLIDKSNRLCLDKAGLIAYAHGEYFALGKKLGKFGYSVQKKKTSRR